MIQKNEVYQDIYEKKVHCFSFCLVFIAQLDPKLVELFDPQVVVCPVHAICLPHLAHS